MTVQAISIQPIAYTTAADKAPNSVTADLFTSSICSLTFINVYGAREHITVHCTILRLITVILPSA